MACVLAVVALFNVPAENSGTAHLDGAHDAELRERQWIRRAVVCTILLKNVGHFESGPGHPALLPGLWFRVVHQRVERTGSTGDDMRRYLHITSRSVNTAMTEQRLDDARVGSTFKKVSGETVAQRMRRDALADAGLPGSVPARC